MQASYVRPSNGTSYAPITTQVINTNVPFSRANPEGACTVSVVATLGSFSSTATTSYVLK